MDRAGFWQGDRSILATVCLRKENSGIYKSNGTFLWKCFLNSGLWKIFSRHIDFRNMLSTLLDKGERF